MTSYEKIDIAQDPSTPPATLAKLAKDASWCVRLQVARNPKTPLATLAELAGDDECFVRESAVKTLKNKLNNKKGTE
jgi:hypothetical protein